MNRIRNRLAAYPFLFWMFLFLAVSAGHGQKSVEPQPNFIIIFADDLGYGDLGIYGHPTLKTPNLDRMAMEGQKWTNFYAAASVCTPSRAALLTGRYPVRSGMSSNVNRVLFPDSKNGLPADEITLAEQLQKVGYSTACIGKWHLGHKEQYLPTNNGFDYYFGIPYSNDMDMHSEKPYMAYWQQPDDSIKTEHFNVPLMRNTDIIERPADQRSISRRYTDEAISYIEQQKGKPFLVYLAHNFPHIPLFASEVFKNTSKRGLYGDVVEEIDHGVGRILKTLEALGLDKNTIVVFTSDNGPWLPFEQNGGSAGLLKDGKGTTWEGGMREPTIFWAPGKIKPASDHRYWIDHGPLYHLQQDGRGGYAIGQGHRRGRPERDFVQWRSRSPKEHVVLQGNRTICGQIGALQGALHYPGRLWAVGGTHRTPNAFVVQSGP